MMIGVTTYGYDAVKYRPKKRSSPVSGMKSQGVDFSREGGKMSRTPGSCFGLSLPKTSLVVFLRRGLHFPKIL